MSMETRMLMGLVIGILLMIVLVIKTKTHTFIALLLAALVAGLIGGLSPGDVVTAVQDGFGNTLKSTGIIIGLGVMMGGILEKSGAAEKLAFSFIKAIGKRKEEWALAITGWLVSIPVFADSALVIFAPLCKAISKVTGKSVVGLSLALAAGLQLTHTMVPPTPGPLTAAGMMNVDVGQMIMLGAVLTIPIMIVVVFYCKWVGRKIYQIPADDGTYIRKDYKKEYIKTVDDLDAVMNQKDLPSLGASVAPIIIPLVLIFVKTIFSLLKIDEGAVYQIVELVGSPIVALGIGTMLAVYGLARKESKKEVMSIMEDSIKSTGIIMLITGAGGALGNVIKVSGIGDVLGELVLNWPIPAILIPVIIAALMRIALGSATVAITTAASLTAPLLGVLGISSLLAAQACCVGAISFSYFNDSGYWVYNGMFGVSELKDQIKCKFTASMIMSGVGVAELLILSLFFK